MVCGDVIGESVEMDMTAVVEVTLLSVEQRGDVIDVQREMELADGSIIRGKHAFPVDTLEWRAAEYGIDPADLDTLLDIVLHEPFLGEPDQPDMLLYDAPTVEEARAYHLARIDAVKAKSKKEMKAGPDSVRERIKQLSVVNPEAVSLKGNLVSKGREMARKDREEKAKSGLRSLFVDPGEQEEIRLARLRAKVYRPTTTLRQEAKK